MNDPRMCSIHLEALPRREEFRHARDRLLHAIGERTIALDGRPEPGTPINPECTIASDVVNNDKRPTAIPTCLSLIDRDRTFQLKVGVNTIGRMNDNDIAILDASISRRHCAILVHAGGECELHDTASKNGTYLNGHRVTAPARLSPGDEIRLCDRKLIFQADGAGGPPDRTIVTD